MIPLAIAILWPPMAAATYWPRSPRAAMVAGILAAGLCVALFIVAGHPPAAAMGAVWVAILGAGWMLGRPVGLSRREYRLERRREAAREAAWQLLLDRAWDELDSADELVPVVLRAPRRVR